MMTHAESKNYPCSATFKVHKYSNHMRRMHLVKPFKCFHCAKNFKIKSDLIQHMDIHSNPKKHQYEHCSDVFNTKLLVHFQNTRTKKEFECHYCSTVMETKEKMRKHIKTMHKCLHCENGIKDSQNPFIQEDSQCEKSFKSDQSLKQTIEEEVETVSVTDNIDQLQEVTGFFASPKKRRFSELTLSKARPRKKPLKPTMKKRFEIERKKCQMMTIALQKYHLTKPIRVQTVTAPKTELPTDSNDITYDKTENIDYKEKYEELLAQFNKFKSEASASNHKLLKENYDLKKDLKAARELGKRTSGLHYRIEANKDKVYDCGVTLTAIQRAELNAFSQASVDDGRYIATLLQISYGTAVLAVSSISGKAKNIATTTKLCEKKLEFVKLMYLTRLENADDKSSRAKLFHEYVNRKIQNVRKELVRKGLKKEKKE